MEKNNTLDENLQEKNEEIEEDGIMDKINDYAADLIDTVEEYIPMGKIVLGFVVFGVLGLITSQFTFPMISSLFAIISNVGVALGIFYVIDRWILTKMNTVKLIESSDNAKICVIMCLTVIICVSILAT